jgi:hypothetical protein
MIQITPEERYWLESNWSQTARSILQIMTPIALESLEAIAAAEPTDFALWDALANLSVQELERRRAASGLSGRGRMYATALALFADREPIRKELLAARPRLTGDQPERVLRSCLRRALLTMRYRLTSDSEHRAKTWTRLDRLSRTLHERRVAARLERAEDGRCHDDHIEALRQYILGTPEEDAKGHAAEESTAIPKLPRTLETLRGYFEEFCPDCGARELDAVTANEIPQLPDADRKIDYLEDCIGDLEETSRQAVQAIYRLDATPDVSIAAYCKRMGVDRFWLYRQAEKAKALLRLCVEGKIQKEIA